MKIWQRRNELGKTAYELRTMNVVGLVRCTLVFKTQLVYSMELSMYL